MKHIIIAILFLLPISVSAQLLRSYGVVEIGATFPTSTVTGAKFAYRTVDSSFYRWTSGNTWVKIVEPSIVPDTLYLTESIGTSYKISGDTINLTPYLLKSDTTAMLVKYIERGDTAAMLLRYPSTAGYGIIDAGKTWRADTTSPNGLATRLFAKTLPSIINSGQIAYSNGSNLVGDANYIRDVVNDRLYVGGSTISTPQTLNVIGGSRLASGTGSGSGTKFFTTNLSGTDPYIEFGKSGSYFSRLYTPSSGVFQFENWSSGSAAVVGKLSGGTMIVNKVLSGNGVSGSTYSKLTLTGNLYPVSTSNPSISLTTFTASGSTDSHEKLNIFGGESGRIELNPNGGNVLIGTTTDVATSILTARSTTKSSSPFPLHTLVESDAITGVQGNFDYETTQNGLRGYNGTRKFYLLESTFARGTATRVPFFDANGQVTESSNLNFTSNQLYVNGIRIGLGNGAMSDNLAIGIDAINATATGNFNVAYGPYSLRALGSGQHNAAFGRLTLAAVTSGSQNMGFGSEVLSSCTTCSSNVGVGYNALRVANTDFNVAVGRNALVALTGSPFNVAIGDRAMVAQSTNTLGRNVAIGASALVSANTSLTVAIGEGSLSGLTSGTGMVAIGRLSGASETTNSNKLHIANTNTKSLIYGDFSTDQVILNATWPPTLKPSVALELISTNKGFLKPSMTAANRTAISSAATGVEVYQTDATEGQYVKYASGWKRNLVEGDATWLKTELEAGRDVDVTGGSGTDFRLRSNTRVQFDGKVKFGSDSSMAYNPADKALVLVGDSGFQPSIYQANTYNSFTRLKFEEYDFRDMYATFNNPKGYNFTRGLSESRIGVQWPIIHKIDSSAALNGWGIINIFGTSLGGSAYQHVFEGGADENEFYFRSRSNISGRAALTVYSQPLTMDVFTVSNTGKVKFAPDSTFKFDPTTDLLQITGTARITGSTGTPNAVVGRDVNGNISNLTLSGLSIVGGALTSDGNGIYTGSGTLANHTTRALIPSTGNLLFSQVYNTTDSAYIQVINNLDGNREVRGGLTDTMSTGFSKFRFYQDEAAESMGYEFATDDTYGTTLVKSELGGINATASENIILSAPEVRLNNGEVIMNQYGAGSMKNTDLGVADTKFVAKFGDGGRVVDYYLARDTFIEDVTLFSVGTMMQSCQELTVVSSMTAAAPTHQEIRFPDAADELRGKKIIVYSKKKDAGSFVPQIKVVGGVSRLYFTTNPAIGGTDPSDQSTLSIDDSVWSDHGTTFEFTCLRIDNTPSYRWVLKQR